MGDLIARFGDGAYFEACDRAQRSAVIDGDRPRVQPPARTYNVKVSVSTH